MKLAYTSRSADKTFTNFKGTKTIPAPKHLQDLGVDYLTVSFGFHSEKPLDMETVVDKIQGSDLNISENWV